MPVTFTAVFPAICLAQLVVSKYLLCEQMNKPILIHRGGHSQELGRQKHNPVAVNAVALLKCYSRAQ